LARLKERTLLLRVGNPLDPETEVGALISDAHTAKVVDYIASGVAEGATLVCGGEQLSIPGQGSNFVAPTIFADCTDTMRIVREEIFGPVLSMLTFDTEEEAIARANPSVKTDGKVIIVADQRIPYGTLKKILGAAARTGFTDFRLAVVQKE
jgi:betaine-aldehyde dehydrogenase